MRLLKGQAGLIAILVLFMAKPFAASANACRDAEYSAGVERPSIHARGVRIQQLHEAIGANASVIESDLRPKLQYWRRSIAVYDTNMGALLESVQAIEFAEQVVREAVVANEATRRLLEQLKTSMGSEPRRRLSEHLHDLVKSANLKKRHATEIAQIANAVAFLERSRKDWLEAEKEIVRLFLEGRKGLYDGLLEKMAGIRQRLVSGYDKLQAGRQSDVNAANEISARIASLETATTANRAEIAALEVANANSQRLLAQYEETLRVCKPDKDPYREGSCSRRFNGC